MKIGLLKTFLHYFQLRQGTILIAILQLVLSSYIMVFFVLGLMHEAGIQYMIVRDTEDVLEREALEEITSKHINSHRMELAHHNATEKVYLLYCGLVIVIVHLVSTILLLYAALMNKRYLMTPWMMVMMTIIVALIISLFLVQEDCPFIAVIGGRANIIDRLLVLSLALICLYMWLVVYSTYRHLEIKKGVVHEVHTVVNDKKYATRRCRAAEKTTRQQKQKQKQRQQQQQHQQLALAQPYEV